MCVFVSVHFGKFSAIHIFLLPFFFFSLYSHWTWVLTFRIIPHVLDILFHFLISFLSLNFILGTFYFTIFSNLLILILVMFTLLMYLKPFGVLLWGSKELPVPQCFMSQL